MAQQVKLKAEKRTLIGRNDIKKIKKEGLVPGVVYGSQLEPMALQVDARELTNVLAHASSEHVLRQNSNRTDRKPVRTGAHEIGCLAALRNGANSVSYVVNKNKIGHGI